MTTAIAVYNSEGCVGRCDAKCHDATPGTPCDCICRGRLHSCGRDNAITQNTIDVFGSLEAAELAGKEWAAAQVPPVEAPVVKLPVDQLRRPMIEKREQLLGRLRAGWSHYSVQEIRKLEGELHDLERGIRATRGLQSIAAATLELI